MTETTQTIETTGLSARGQLANAVWEYIGAIDETKRAMDEVGKAREKLRLADDRERKALEAVKEALGNAGLADGTYLTDWHFQTYAVTVKEDDGDTAVTVIPASTL